MSKKQVRRGGKYGDNHCTFIALAADVCDEIIKSSSIEKVYGDIITTSGGKSGSRKHVKIGEISENVILLQFTDGSTYQKVRVHVTSMQIAKEYIASSARDSEVSISFQKAQPNG